MATLTLYSTAADARISVTNASFATARAATTGTLQAASSNPSGIGDLLNGGNYTLHRFFMSFAANTPGTPTSATFSFQISGSTGSNRTVHLVEASHATPVVADDFNNISFTSFGSVSLTGDGVFSITVNSAGLTYIESAMGGTIRLALIGSGDQSDSAPSTDTLKPMYTGDEATQQKPKLEITYPVNSPSVSPSASASPSPSSSASASPSPSPSLNTLSVDLIEGCFSIAYEDVYETGVASAYTALYTSKGC